MRTRLLALAALSVVVAGCGTGAVSAAGGQGTSVAASAATPAATAGSAAATPVAASAGQTGSAPAGSGAAVAPAHGSSCAGSQAPSYPPGIDGLQFVSPAQGWAVSQDAILATADGGTHWTR
jgi:hypothetical protein